MFLAIQTAVLAFALVALLVGSGYALGRWSLDMELNRIAGLLIQRQANDIEQLAALRMFLELEGGGVSTEQALLLTDVCTQLGYSEGDTQRIVGPAYLWASDMPIEMGEGEHDEQ